MTTIPRSPFLSAEPAYGDYSQASQHYNGDLQPDPADTAAALSQPRDAAAELIPSSTGGPQGVPAVETNPLDAGATDHIHEIFHYARMLYADDHRFVLDEQAFMEAIEPPPLFLQRATG